MLTKKMEINNQDCREFSTKLGMTLIELLVVVVIVGVLAALTFSSFSEQILAVRRGDGITYLLRLKLQQEAFRIENISYAKTAQLSLPSSKYYVFTVTDTSATTYRITAKAKGSQTADTKCLSMEIDQSLIKTPASCFF
jgi:type IV pilus assembly protein PilE